MEVDQINNSTFAKSLPLPLIQLKQAITARRMRSKGVLGAIPLDHIETENKCFKTKPE